MRAKDRKIGIFSRCVTWSVLIAFAISLMMPAQVVFAQVRPATILNLPVPGAMVPATAVYQPAIIRGLTIFPDNPFEFDFIVDTGDDHLSGDALSTESTRLIKYFMASLTVPDDQMWVNLSPYEADRIIPQDFGQTEMGRDLLAQDYLLKQLSASLMYPEDELGREFWKRVHQRAQQEYGSNDIPMNTFNKIWIVPEKADVYVKDNSVYVVNSHLKVMLEEDYLALEMNQGSTQHGLGDVQREDLDVVSGVTAEVVREILIPEIEREINQGRTFANLRQIYHSMILATWYKKNLKASLLGKVYIDQSKTLGVHSDDPAINQKIYEQYVRSFKKGVYDYIREDKDPVTKQITPRKYFSGGVDQTTLDLAVKTVDAASLSDIADFEGTNVRVRAKLGEASTAHGSTTDRELEESLAIRGQKDLPRILQPWFLFYRMFLQKSVTVRGLEHLPNNGSYIMAGNHLGNGLDGLLLVTEIYLTTGQLPAFVVRSEQNSLGPLSQKLLFWITNWMEHHGIILTMQKKYGITGLRKMLQTLQEQHAIIGIYPGSDSWEDLSKIDPEDFLKDVSRWKPGFVRIAKRFGIPILPFRESGDFPSRMIVSFAPPVYPQGKEPAQILEEVKQGVLSAETTKDVLVARSRDTDQTLGREVAVDAAMDGEVLVDMPMIDNPYGAEFRVSRNFDTIDKRYNISDNFEADQGAPKNVLLIGAGRGFTAVEMALQYPHLNITAVNKEAGLFRRDILREQFGGVKDDGYLEEALSRIRPVTMDLNDSDSAERVLGAQGYDYIILETSTQMYFRDKIGIIQDLYNNQLNPGGVTAFYLEDIYLPQTHELDGLTEGEKQDASLQIIEGLLMQSFAGKAVLEPVNDAAFEDPAYMYKYRKVSDQPVDVPLRLSGTKRVDITKVPGLFFYEAIYEITIDTAMTTALSYEFADLFQIKGPRGVMTTLKSSWYNILRAELDYISENQDNPDLQPRRIVSQLTLQEEIVREKSKWKVLNRMGLLRAFYLSKDGQFSYAIPKWIFEELRKDPRSFQELIEENIPHLDKELGLFSSEYAEVGQALKIIEARISDQAMASASLQSTLERRERAINRLLAIDTDLQHRHKEHIELEENRDPLELLIKEDLRILDPATFDFALDPELPDGFSSNFHHTLMKISDNVFVFHGHLKASFNTEYDPSGKGNLGEKGGGGLFILFEQVDGQFKVRHIFISPDLGNYVLPAISLNSLVREDVESHVFWRTMYSALEASATRYLNEDIKQRIDSAISENKIQHYLGQSIFGQGKNRLFEFITKKVAATQDEDGIIADRERGIFYEVVRSIDQIDADEAMVVAKLNKTAVINARTEWDKGVKHFSDLMADIFEMGPYEQVYIEHRNADREFEQIPLSEAKARNVQPNITKLGITLGYSEGRSIRVQIKNYGIQLYVSEQIQNLKTDEIKARIKSQFTDAAMKAPGGIDLNPQALHLNERGDAIQLSIPGQSGNYPNTNTNGFVPVIINITPAPSLPMLLGLVDEEQPIDIGQISNSEPLANRKTRFEFIPG